MQNIPAPRTVFQIVRGRTCGIALLDAGGCEWYTLVGGAGYGCLLSYTYVGTRSCLRQSYMI